MDQQSTYNIIFKGKIKQEHDKDFVTQSMCDLFHITEEKAKAMLAARSVTLKKSLNRSQAQQYITTLDKIGLVVETQPPLEETAKPTLTLEETQNDNNTPKVAPSNPARTFETSLSLESSGNENETAPQVTQQSTHTDAQQSTKPAAQQVAATNSQYAYVNPSMSDNSIKLKVLDKAFTGTVQPIKLPLQYRAGIIFTGMSMALLPLIYLGLIGAVAFGVHYHAVENITLLKGGGIYFRALLYCAPILAGTILILFMIKPIFARSMAEAKSISVDPIKEPKLFYFVKKIAACVGAPVPTEIKLNCEVNASAGFRNGFASFFSNDLVLTLGMPLVAGFNLRQLAGVLAHEFGHFAQGTGMRFHYAAWKINTWFFNAVHHRDSWDAKLEYWAQKEENWLGVILQISRGLVWLTRRILYGFMLTGQLISNFSLRQMEFDADRYEASVAGSEQFKQTCLALQKLMVAMQVSHEHLAQTWEDGKLVDDLPSLISRSANELPEELDSELMQKMSAYKTHVFDSHPSDQERIKNALQLKSSGIFTLENPAADLFKHYKVWARHVTYYHYHYDLGLNIERDKLIDVDEVVSVSRENNQDKQALEKFFGELMPDFKLPLTIKLIDTSKYDWTELANKLNKIRDKVTLSTAAHATLEKYHADKKQLNLLYAVDTLTRAGFHIDPETFGVSKPVFDNLDNEIATLNTTITEYIKQLAPVFKLQYTRFSLALTLLNHPQVIDKISDHSDAVQKRHRLSVVLNELYRHAGQLEQFQRIDFKLAALLHFTHDEFDVPEGYDTLSSHLMENVRDYTNRFTESMARLNYPFENDNDKTISDHISAMLPKRDDYGNDLHYYSVSATTLLEKLGVIQYRALGALARLALEIETILLGEQIVQTETEGVTPLETASARAVNQ